MDCGVSAIRPLPSDAEIGKFYEDYYLTRSSDTAITERLVTLHEPICRWLLSRFPHASQLRVLDYGFGSGAFLLQMARWNAAAFGIDLSRQNVEQLRAYCRPRGISIGLAEFSGEQLPDLGGGEFDLITLFQVIEHVKDPFALVQRLSKLQRGNGYIYLECPNEAAMLAWAKRFTRITESRKAIWGSLRYPEHLYGFNRRALTRMLEIAGYEVEMCGDYYYRDGVHQVEAETWWPPMSANPNLRSIYGLSRSVIPIADKLASKMFHAGSGLYAFARKSG